MEKKDYTVRYTDSHITLTKNGEKKGIRVDTLAKTFGDKFTKENLEKKMGYFRKAEIKPKSELNTSTPVKKKNAPFGTENRQNKNPRHLNVRGFRSC